jgi:hypothetical protein
LSSEPECPDHETAPFKDAIPVALPDLREPCVLNYLGMLRVMVNNTIIAEACPNYCTEVVDHRSKNLRSEGIEQEYDKRTLGKGKPRRVRYHYPY